MKRMLMIILKVVFMLHFERVHGFMLKVQNSLISNRVIRIKTINKSFNRQLHLCNDSFTDESTGTRSNELGDTERDGPSMKALEEAQEGAPDEFVIMKEVRVYDSLVGHSRFSSRPISYPAHYLINSFWVLIYSRTF